MSFKGGIPNIPKRFPIPHCTQCGAEMTFFFQIAFPRKHMWEGRTITFFHCTACANMDNYWPKTYYTRGQDNYPNIPDGFLDTYQTNFRIYVFETTEPVIQRNEAKHVLKFERLSFEKLNPRVKYYNTTKVGGIPAWDLSKLDGADEIYKEVTYMGAGFDFLMQVERDWSFTRLPETPPQFDYYKEGSPVYNLYNPFMGPKMYFLGTTAPQLDPPRVLLYLM
jgi:hypothetical protein